MLFRFLMMRRWRTTYVHKDCLVTLPLLPIVLSVSLPNLGGNFQEGRYAYDRFDYHATLRDWSPAEQENARAQKTLSRMYQHGLIVAQNGNNLFQTANFFLNTLQT